MSDAFESEETVSIPIKTFRVLAWVFSALIAGGGGAFAVRGTNPAPYDRFTGDDGIRLAEQLKQWAMKHTEGELEPILKDIVRLEARIEQCRKNIANLPPRYLLAEVSDMQKQALVTRTEYKEMAKTLERILKHDQSHVADAIEWRRQVDRNTQELKHLRERYGLSPNSLVTE